MKIESKAKLRKLKTEARERIASRGKLEFRADEDLIKSVLALAAKQKQPVGPMLRQWIKERIEAERTGRPQVPDKLEKIDQKLESLCALVDNLIPSRNIANRRIARKTKLI